MATGRRTGTTAILVARRTTEADVLDGTTVGSLADPGMGGPGGRPLPPPWTKHRGFLEILNLATKLLALFV